MISWSLSSARHPADKHGLWSHDPVELQASGRWVCSPCEVNAQHAAAASAAAASAAAAAAATAPDTERVPPTVRGISVDDDDDGILPQSK